MSVFAFIVKRFRVFVRRFTQLMAVFSQNPDIEQDIRFQLMQEADSVMADLHQVLEGVWLREPTNEQINFLEDFISLVKNLFDSAIAKLS